MAQPQSEADTDTPLMGVVSPFESGESLVATIPADVRDALNVDEDSALFYRVRGNRIEFEKTSSLELDE